MDAKQKYAIKRRGQILCGFMFHDGLDYRPKGNISYFANVFITTNKQEANELAIKYDGKLVRV